MTDPRAQIRKLGTIDVDMVETTPVVFGDRLYRFEYVRADYHANRRVWPARPTAQGSAAAGAAPHFRFVDVATGAHTPAFADGFHLGSALVEGDEVFAFGVEAWGQSRLFQFRSRDLERWTPSLILDLPGWSIFNTSACRDREGWVLAFEVGEPAEVVGQRFTNFFARSADLARWRPEPLECAFARDRYTACPALRYLDGWYYVLYLEARPGPTYETWIARSRDLVAWELSLRNPVLAHGDGDRRAHPRAVDLSAAQRERIATAANLNNSDLDLCEHRDQVALYYSWGNQQGIEHLAEARWDGTLAGFLTSWF